MRLQLQISPYIEPLVFQETGSPKILPLHLNELPYEEQQLYSSICKNVFSQEKPNNEPISKAAATALCLKIVNNSDAKISAPLSAGIAIKMQLHFGEPEPKLLHLLHEKLVSQNDIGAAQQLANHIIKNDEEIKQSLLSTSLQHHWYMRDVITLGHPKLAISTFDKLEPHKINHITYYLRFLALLQLGDYSACYDMIKLKQIVTAETCNALFIDLITVQHDTTHHNHANLNHSSLAFNLVQTLKNYNLLPTPQHYTRILERLVDENDIDIALQVAEDAGPLLDREGYVYLIEGLIKSGKLAQAKAYSEKMASLGYRLNPVCHSRILNFHEQHINSSELDTFALLIAPQLIEDKTTSVTFHFPNNTPTLLQYLVPAYIQETQQKLPNQLFSKQICLHAQVTPLTKRMTLTCVKKANERLVGALNIQQSKITIIEHMTAL